MSQSPKLKIRILGSGTSTGVPTIGCDCKICKSKLPKNKRTRSSILIEDLESTQRILIDTSPDLRAQALAAGLNKLDYVLYTHIHADHCHGFDDLRAFYFQSKRAIPCYLSPQFHEEFKIRFAYAFKDTGYLGTAPQVELLKIPNQAFEVGGLSVEPIQAPHGNMKTTGFRIGNFAYLTDFKTLPDTEIVKWQGKVDTMVASGLRFREHPTHSTVSKTLTLFETLGVKKGYLTHLSHEVDYLEHQDHLPKHVTFAYDGLEFLA